MYQLTQYPESIRRLADGAMIPTDPANRDYAEYLAWVAEGNAPEPAAVPVPLPVPAAISRRQFYQALAVSTPPYITPAEALAAMRTGDIPAVLASLLDTLPEEERFAAEMLLIGADDLRREHELTAAIGAARGMTDAEVDAFFRFAATL
ncbi:MAG TPA: hypothetical protein VD978_12155 [Azospirillum sp.]|nr:hypothetical protein [Azospirillum sp.]